MPGRDDAWLRDLYHAHWVSMVGFATLLVGSVEVAEQIVQDALVAAHHRRRQFLTIAHAGEYLRNAVLHRTRSADRRRIPAHQGHGEAQVLAVIDTLPQRQREVLVLRYFCDNTEVEVASALGISRGAVRSHAHRGLQAVRESGAMPGGQGG